MKLQNDEIRELLIKYGTGECTEAEKALLERWYLHRSGAFVGVSAHVCEERSNLGC